MDVIARVRGELAVAETKIAAQGRVIEGAQRREEVWCDLIYQEKGERRALLERIPLLPAPKEGFWSRIFRGVSSIVLYYIVLYYIQPIQPIQPEQPIQPIQPEQPIPL